MTFSKGQIIKVPCEVQPGAFPAEYLINVRAGKESISGFIPKNLVTLQNDNKGYILGRIVEVKVDLIRVQLPGSFFTTAAGVTSVPSIWARENFQLAAA